jgi:hypothetical protein
MELHEARASGETPRLTPPDALRAWHVSRSWLGVAGVAAALLLAAWAGTRPTRPAAVIEERRNARAFMTPTEPSGLETADAVPPLDARSADPSSTRVVSRESALEPPAAPPVTRVVESFLPLLPMTDGEFGIVRLARVRLPGRAADALGFDLWTPAPGADGFVEADVLLGEDGMARAIRFVR